LREELQDNRAAGADETHGFIKKTQKTPIVRVVRGKNSSPLRPLRPLREK